MKSKSKSNYQRLNNILSNFSGFTKGWILKREDEANKNNKNVILLIKQFIFEIYCAQKMSKVELLINR